MVFIAAGAILAAGQGTRHPLLSYPARYPDLGITLLDQWVVDLDVPRDGKTVFYSRHDPLDWYTDIWTCDRFGGHRHCFSCDLAEPAKHRGGVSWQPSGRFVAFSAENDDVRGRKGDRMAEPEVGLNTNLWVMSADGARAWRMTDYETDYANPRGVVYPHFSPDGKRLAWSGPVDYAKTGAGREWGEWAVFLADFNVEAGVPSIANVRMLQPGEQHGYYQVDDWSADGRRLLLSANPNARQSVTGLDICELDLVSGALRNLTRTPGDWDQFAHYAPDGRHVVWASSRGLTEQFRSLEGVDWRRDVRTDLWEMTRDGARVRRLTFFNQAGSRDHAWFQSRVARAPDVYVADNAFAGDGSHVAAILAYETPQGLLGGVLAMLDLNVRRPTDPAVPAFGR
jgi:Tol biopolymer transport system component